MPELPEVEAYRRLAETRGRTHGRRRRARPTRGISSAASGPARRRGRPPRARRIAAARRRGQAAAARHRRQPADARLAVRDDRAAGRRRGRRRRPPPLLERRRRPGVGPLRPPVLRPRWLVVRDPRRLGGVELDPDEHRLGPDAAAVTACRAPRRARRQRRAAQGPPAGPVPRSPGSATSSPTRCSGGPASTRRGRPAPSARARGSPAGPGDAARRSPISSARGGSHTGDLMAARVAGGRCPRDGAVLVHRTVGGRSTWSCPAHQK